MVGVRERESEKESECLRERARRRKGREREREGYTIHFQFFFFKRGQNWKKKTLICPVRGTWAEFRPFRRKKLMGELKL